MWRSALVSYRRTCHHTGCLRRDCYRRRSCYHRPSVVLSSLLPGVGGALLLTHQAALWHSVALRLREGDTALLVTTIIIIR